MSLRRISHVAWTCAFATANHLAVLHLDDAPLVDRPWVVPVVGAQAAHGRFSILSWGWGLRRLTCPRARPHENGR